MSRHEGLEPTPGVLVARVDGPLFFADADRFRASLQEFFRQDETVTGVVIDAEAVHLTDTDGADILIQVTGEWKSRGALLVLARVHPPVLELWRRAGVVDAVGEDRVFETISDAVRSLDGSQTKGATP